MSLATIQYLDYSGEKSSVSFNVATPSGAAYDFDALIADVDAVADAIDAVCLCTRGPDTLRVEMAAGSVTLPTDENAQREAGLRIFYHDATNNKKYHVTIPGPDKSLMAVQGFDYVDWAGAEMVALETAFEANVLSPDGNAVVIDKGTLVGRRN
jgi:hypothetical protein